jgi:hypothetical protein
MNPQVRGLLTIAVFVAGVVVGGSAAFTWTTRQQLATLPPASGSAKEDPARLWEATIFVPVVDSEGRRFDETEWQRALDILVADFGGATLGNEQEGWWLDARKEVHREPVRPITISFERKRLDEFRASVREVGRRLRQESMYVRLEEPRIEILKVPPENSEKDR